MLPKKFLFSKKILLLILFIKAFHSDAQLCNGSLGDPVVNITFGTGTGFGAPLAAATTKYTFIASACPENGFYTLINKGVECNYGWHVLQGDHTGNANGYFMLIDASFEASDFYVDTVKTLCSNTTYEFAAWMLNMKYFTQGTRPNITFSIETVDGVVLQTYNSGNIPVEQTIQWKKYGFYFTTPPNIAAVVLRMTNNAPGGDGNDLALDDITFRPCGKLITASVAGYPGDTISICDNEKGAQFSLNATIASGYVNPVYQWQLSSNSGNTWTDIENATDRFYQRQPTDTGTYFYRFTVAEAAASGTSCRVASKPIVMYLYSKPAVSAGPDIQVLSGFAVQLAATGDGGNVAYMWMPPLNLDDAAKLTPTVTATRDVQYSISATSVSGCTAVDTMQLKVLEKLYIPSAFSPNGDGNNDLWRIPLLLPGYRASMQVFNRFGKVVYQSNNSLTSWDGNTKGTPQPVGAYVYQLRFENGIKMKGMLMLIR